MAVVSVYDEEITRPETLEKYYRVINRWLENGYNSVEAYQSVYPTANHQSALKNFSKIRNMPRFKDYIMQQRQLAYEAKNIDLMRITEELADVAFADIKDENVPVAQKVKSLEILLKALREDAAAQKSSNIITVGIEDDEDDEG